jgi:trans-2,3-dihydro-3-hydroxyanthranilate isomerase
MRSYRYLHLDVFTDRLFGGNQLAVFLDGRGLSSDAMQAIAKEMNFSETTFVLPPAQPETEFHVRIFTPGGELPMAGHPVIGTAFALARAGVLHSHSGHPGRDQVVFGLDVGPTHVSLVWHGDQLSFAWMTQRNPVFGTPLLDLGAAAAVLRLPPAAVAGAGLPVQMVSCGVPYLLVPLATRRAVDNAALDADAYDAFHQAAGLDELSVFVFSNEPGADKATVYSRCFAPQHGVAEDAATGSASGPLGCYLVHHKAVSAERAGSMLSLQGVKMGRPSHVHISIGVTDGAISNVRVGGESVLAGEGLLYI